MPQNPLQKKNQPRTRPTLRKDCGGQPVLERFEFLNIRILGVSILSLKMVSIGTMAFMGMAWG